MGVPPIGPTTVDCPTCLVRVGRRCVDARGYLYEGGAHVRRRQAWLGAEADELAAIREPAAV